MTLYQGGRGSHGELVEPWQGKPPRARFDQLTVTTLYTDIQPFI